MLFAALISGCVIDLRDHDGDIWGSDGSTDSGWTGSDWTYGYPDAPTAVGSYAVTSTVWMASRSVALTDDGRFGGADLGSAVCHFVSNSGQIDSDIGTDGSSSIDVGGLTDDGGVSVGHASGDAWAVSDRAATAFGLDAVVATAVEGDTVAVLGGSRCAVHLGDAGGSITTRIPHPAEACARGGLRFVDGHAYTSDGANLLLDGAPGAVATAATLFDVEPASDHAFLVEGDSLRAVRLSTGETLWTADAGGTIRAVGVGGSPARVHVVADRGTRWFGAWDLDGGLATEADVEGYSGSGGWALAVARSAGTVALGTGDYLLILDR